MDPQNFLGFPAVVRYDNVCIESFHRVLKKELVYLHKFKTKKEAREKIFEYITCFYNGIRIHSAIGSKSKDRRHQGLF
ncbi:IS3 family transposase [Cohnella laeviribosi]|uniref:IS3 family transposase n=1 Tax=Cohnella laeviribosi TaxID=380174 RepID=UPI0006891648